MQRIGCFGIASLHLGALDTRVVDRRFACQLTVPRRSRRQGLRKLRVLASCGRLITL